MVLWIGYRPLPQDGFSQAPTTDLCSIVNQLDYRPTVYLERGYKAKNLWITASKYTLSEVQL